MLYSLSIPSLLLLLATSPLSSGHESHAHVLPPSPDMDTVPFATRAFWMRRANDALGELDSPGPFAAFGTVIVNHTDLREGPHGKAICSGVNSRGKTGNPTRHGEISGIHNCSRIFTDPAGEYRMPPSEA
ncbi:cytidine and deoxycytidylate deaminase zinc-binding region [Diplocarpon rosae]|nr:cytidine and deoxycytidylate deaminase zinc-binding region [Diplocarpon rosae]